MRVLLLSTDLMTVSRVEGAAARTGAKVCVASNADRAIELHAAEACDLVIIDLSTTSSADVAATVPCLKSAASTAPRIAAFGPHVHEDRLAAAQAAGCDIVMARGQFFAQVDTFLQA
jgi:DNA-binding NarL/FixJ family response regulator